MLVDAVNMLLCKVVVATHFISDSIHFAPAVTLFQHIPSLLGTALVKAVYLRDKELLPITLDGVVKILHTIQHAVCPIIDLKVLAVTSIFFCRGREILPTDPDLFRVVNAREQPCGILLRAVLFGRCRCYPCMERIEHGGCEVFVQDGFVPVV